MCSEFICTERSGIHWSGKFWNQRRLGGGSAVYGPHGGHHIYWLMVRGSRWTMKRLRWLFLPSGNTIFTYILLNGHPHGTMARDQGSFSFWWMEFKSIAVHKKIHPYPIPYQCLYSRNVDNLFMAGRNISVTHVALGTIWVIVLFIHAENES